MAPTTGPTAAASAAVGAAAAEAPPARASGVGPKPGAVTSRSMGTGSAAAAASATGGGGSGAGAAKPAFKPLKVRGHLSGFAPRVQQRRFHLHARRRAVWLRFVCSTLSVSSAHLGLPRDVQDMLL